MAGKVHQKRFSFVKEERLKSKKLIDSLFSQKTFVQNSTIRIYYQCVAVNCAFPAQFAFVASKRIFPNAVDRNRIKRLMRESIRLQKPDFYTTISDMDKTVILLLNYQAKEIKTYAEIYQAIESLLAKLCKKIN
ncbi:MAG: ribonuclease P protein component [Chitinophagales bacterium]